MRLHKHPNAKHAGIGPVSSTMSAHYVERHALTVAYKSRWSQNQLSCPSCDEPSCATEMIHQWSSMASTLASKATRRVRNLRGQRLEQVSLPPPEIRSLAPQTKTRHLHCTTEKPFTYTSGNSLALVFTTLRARHLHPTCMISTRHTPCFISKPFGLRGWRCGACGGRCASG